MLKTIKVQQMVYDKLDQLRDKRETFGECIERLIKAYDQIRQITAAKQEVRG